LKKGTKVNRRATIILGSTLLLASACGGSDKPQAQGTLTIADGGIYKVSDGSCEGTSSHLGLKPGTTVTVYSDSNKVLGSGAFDSGKLTNDDKYCELHFSFELSGSSPNYQISFGSSDQKAIVKDISKVDLAIGQR
jgi:hypothetical protein